MKYELYNAALSHIERHPEEWNQANPLMQYAGPCCLLGHAQRMAGMDWRRQTSVAGREALALSHEQANWLWHPHRTLDEFRAVRLAAASANFPA